MKEVKNNIKPKKLWLKIFLIFVGVLFAVISVYVIYVYVSYSRIEDNQTLIIEGNAEHRKVKRNTEYTALSYNIGFGAHIHPILHSLWTEGHSHGQALRKV